MFKVESYVTPILLSYVDKYVRDFKPADAQVSLWGGGVALHNLVLKADVLQQELALPFTLVSGRIHELLIQVPWTKIMSEPIVVTINTIECVLSDPPDLCDENTPIDQPRHHVVEEAPPGYMQALVRRIVGNISVRVNSLIVKYAYDDVVLSLNVKRLSIDSVGPDWEPAFTDIETSNLITRRLVRLDDLTLCLDRSDSDGKIRHYQEPLLYRCQLEIRIMMSLQALHTRALRNLAVQVRSCNLEWGVTSEQVVLLSRLVRERPQPAPTAAASQLPPSTTTAAVSSTNALEPTHSESWTDWAWSWMPSWTEPDDPEEAIFQGKPFPIMFSAFFDKVTFVYKVTETVAGNRKRARPLLELTAGHAVVTYLVVVPTLLRVRIGARTITLSSQGKCVCGHLDYNALKRKPTVYVKPNYQVEDEYEWPEGTMDMKLADPDIYTEPKEVSPDDESDEDPEDDWMQEASKRSSSPEFRNKECVEEVWFKMAPVVLLQYEHERQPPDVQINPYENPPRDFENSDWLEKVKVGVSVRPMLVSVSTGLLHRLDTLRALLNDMPSVVAPAIVVRPLTVEECDALTENIPERKVRVKMMGFVVQVLPWDHSLIEPPLEEPLACIEVYTKKINIRMCGPLYPIRVCAAACQMPDKTSKLYDMAYLRLSVSIFTAMGRLGIPTGRLQRPIFKFTAFFRGQYLLNRELFDGNDTVFFSGNFSLPTEMNIYMTPAAMETLVEVVLSLYEDRVSTLLRDTSVTFDAFEENDTTAVDGVFNRITILPRICKNAIMCSILIHSIKMTGVEIKGGYEGNVAWLFSAPDMILEQDWLEFRFQYCQDANQPEALDYLLINTQVCAISLDPLLMNFLNYRPRMRPQNESSGKNTGKSSKAFLWRRTTPPSSSGRGTRPGSVAEFVHTRTRSVDSVSESSERRDSSTDPGHKKTKMQVNQWDNETILRFYNRLRHMMVRMNLGIVMLYTTASTASALETSSVQDAMERHAVELQRVLVFSSGRWDVRSSGVDLSEFARFDRPTVMNKNLRLDENFPWKIKITAISSYTLETSPPAKMTDEDRELVRTQSQSRTTIRTSPCIILESLQSSMTISVVSKTAASKSPKRHDPKPPPPPTEEDQKEKYFTGGIDFTPMTLKDFVRGPTARPAPPDGHSSPEPQPEPNPEDENRGDGPLASLGVCIHGDTPPARLTLRHDQIHIVRAAVHCLAHIWALLKRPRMPLSAPKSLTNRPGSAPPYRTTASEQRSSSEETPSENPSERLIPIFESRAASQEDKRIKTFIWFQWVFSRVSVGLVTDFVKITMVIDDAIATIDLQENYEQFRLKISTGTIYHYVHKESDGELDMDVWVLGELGGRVLETRESPDGKSVNFFSTTITRARYANLPASWREDLTNKRTRKHVVPETMSEMFISMAPLEVILHPDAIRGLTLIGKTLLLNSFCPVQLNHGQVTSEAAIQEEIQQHNVNGVSMPFMHVDMGGMRVILNNNESTNYHDDTLVLNIGSVTVLPYPDNPICRRTISAVGEANWVNAATGSDGRQHEVIIKGLGVKTARIKHLLSQMAEVQERSKRNVNPAANWAEPLPRVVFRHILHSVDVQVVFAPPIYVDGKMACGPAFEVNISNDVNVEISLEQIAMLHNLLPKLYDGCTNLQYGNEDTPTILDITNWCPFSELVVLDEDEEDGCINESTSGVSDSGVEMPRRKKFSVPAYEKPLGLFELMEVFLVMGRIDAALYVRIDRSWLVKSLRLPVKTPFKKRKKEKEPKFKIVIEPSVPESSRKDSNSALLAESKSLTEDVRKADVGRSSLNVVSEVKLVRRLPMFIPLVHVTLKQPNMYYWRKRNLRGSQMSLFNMWVALGEGQDDRLWHHTLITTRTGVPDPETDIPPSLASVRMDTLPASSVVDQQQWVVKVDIERPVIVDINRESLKRIKKIIGVFEIYLPSGEPDPIATGPLNKVHQFMMSGGVERVTVNCGQVGLQWLPWKLSAAAVRVQLATARHPARLCARVLLEGLLLSTNLFNQEEENHHIILHPVMFGVQAEAAWKPSVTGEHSPFTAQPTVRLAVEMDDVCINFRPFDVREARYIYRALKSFFRRTHTRVEQPRFGSDENIFTRSTRSLSSNDCVFATHEVYYKDDLRSGAFKIMSGEQARMPMAYEVSLRGSTVVWHYPVPRFIARITALPLPDCDEEIDCVLESFNHLLGRWEPNTYFQIPVNEKKEYRMNSPNNDKIFAQMWRVRLALDQEENQEPFEFVTAKYKQDDAVVRFNFPAEEWAPPGRVTAEQLAGALRVDSYLSAKLASRMQVALRFGSFAIYLHNKLPPFLPAYPNDVDMPFFEGIFVNPALRRTHRALALVMTNTVINIITSACNKMLSYESRLGLDIYESETGALERLIDDFRVQGIVTYADKLRVRVRAGDVRVMLNAPRMRTLRMMLDNWTNAYKSNFVEFEFPNFEEPYIVQEELVEQDEEVMYTWNSDRLKLIQSTVDLDGRVYLYVVNTCDVPLRVGQEGTDEMLLLNARTTLAYRWNSPLAPKRLRFALWGAGLDFIWSTGLPYVVGMTRVRLLANGEASTRSHDGVFLYVNVEDAGSRMYMNVGGRIVLGNFIKEDICYKIRVRDATADDGMRIISSGDMRSQSVGLTVLCSTVFRDVYLKIKFQSHPSGWTGDIPLKECPKEHVPWLVKVPAVGDVPCMSVWCRVERTRADNRITVSVHPMFIMCSHLPLDIDVVMTTDPMDEEDSSTTSAAPVLTQPALGRGHITQLKAYGTTTVRHTMTFHYKSVADCVVTQDTVPLHYGLTESSVFETHTPPPYAEDIAVDMLTLLNTTSSEAKRDWPYSPVRSHWPGKWGCTEAQPRCDVLVRYYPVKCGGGGCGMVAHVMSRVLIANAATVPLTLRAANAAPICRLPPGSVSAPPSDILNTPFYMSIDEDNCANLSEELCLSREEPGVYGSLPSGHLAVDRTTDITILCDNKVSFLTLHYTMNLEMHVFGVTSSYLFVNKLKLDLFIYPLVVQDLPGNDEKPVLKAKHCKAVIACSDDLKKCVRLCEFWMCGRFVREEVRYLQPFLCFTLAGEYHRSEKPKPVPVQIGPGLKRRSIALRDDCWNSVAVVVTQTKHEGRWVITAAADPCPQFEVHNYMKEPLTIAHVRRRPQHLLFNDVPVMREVMGLNWWYVVDSLSWSYYSTMTYMEHTSCKAPDNETEPPHVAHLTLGKLRGEHEPEWSAPFIVVEGEHLVQLTQDLKIKVKVQMHPHSTRIELRQVKDHEVSASEIRQRLVRYTPQDPEEAIIRLNHSDTRLTDELKLLQKQWREDEEQSFDESGNKSDHSKSQLTEEKVLGEYSAMSIAQMDLDSETSLAQDKIRTTRISDKRPLSPTLNDWLRATVGRVVVELAHSRYVSPLVRASLERVTYMLQTDTESLYNVLTIGDFQLDNTQHDTQQYDFAVVASTSAEAREDERFPALWGMLMDDRAFDTRIEDSNVVLRVTHDKWTACEQQYQQVGEFDVYVGPMSLYVEDAFISEASQLMRLLVPQPELNGNELVAAEMAALRNPLRLRMLNIHELDIMLTLHTAIRLYIAVDRSRVQLSSFKLESMVTTPDKLMHDLTVHYLSGAMLAAGWVVGGLELLGAPGSLASRVASARGGLRGLVSTTAGAVLRSINSCAGSLARNLDMLAGDDEHTQRAAAARRVHPPTFMAGISAGVSNFAVNILGAVGGIAHHPLVGLAVGEASGASALRRGLVGALAKPLSATADLLAFAGQGLLSQTGWDPDPQQRKVPPLSAMDAWRRDCVRWWFRMHTLIAFHGLDATLDDVPVRLIVTDKFLVIAEPSTERIVEMIDYRFCKLISFDGQMVELRVTQRRPQNRDTPERSISDMICSQSMAMARVARFTGVGGAGGEGERLRVRTPPHRAVALAAALAAVLQQDTHTYFPLL